MTKKVFAQPELAVVTIKHTDIVTASPMNVYEWDDAHDSYETLAPDRFGM